MSPLSRFRVLFFAGLIAVLVAIAPHTAIGQTAKATIFGPIGLNTNATVAQGSDGLYYGTADSDFSNGGAVYAVSSTGTFTYPYSFTGETDGGIPEAPPVEGPDGSYYGVAGAGGANGQGVIYKIAGGTYSVVYNFTGGADGAQPESSLIFDNAGNLYGVAPAYGSYNQGAIFKFNINTKTLTPLYQFCPADGCLDGSQPRDGLVMGTDGFLYGTVGYGGAYGGGTFFKISTSGTFTLLYSFCTTHFTNCPEGYFPKGALVEGPDGNFYGVNQTGGTNTFGTVYKITPGGAITPLYAFTGGTDGTGPQGLTMASDGNLYVATQVAGNTTACNNSDVSGCGSVVKVTPSGTYTLIYDFLDDHGDATPYAGPMQGSDGDIYGTTSGFVTGDSGAVYKLALSPALAAPVQLSLSESSVSAGTAVTLSWKVLNAFSSTLQQCYAYVQGGATGAGTWTGQQPGSYSASTKLYTGSSKITPTANGTYIYALTCGGAESGFATLTVGSSKKDSSTALIASPNPATVGESVTLTATVTGSAATPAGSVSYAAAGIAIGSGSLNGSGVSAFTASTNGIAPGSYPIVATYAGNSTYNSSSSNAVTVKLNKAPTATTLTASPTSVTRPASVSLTATVKRSAGTGVPTGTVTFAVGTTALATVKVNGSGVAALTASTSGQAAGSYPVKAIYNGDASDVTSTSSAVTVTLK